MLSSRKSSISEDEIQLNKSQKKVLKAQYQLQLKQFNEQNIENIKACLSSINDTLLESIPLSLLESIPLLESLDIETDEYLDNIDKIIAIFIKNKLSISQNLIKNSDYLDIINNLYLCKLKYIFINVINTLNDEEQDLSNNAEIEIMKNLMLIYIYNYDRTYTKLQYTINVILKKLNKLYNNKNILMYIEQLSTLRNKILKINETLFNDNDNDALQRTIQEKSFLYENIDISTIPNSRKSSISTKDIKIDIPTSYHDESDNTSDTILTPTPKQTPTPKPQSPLPPAETSQKQPPMPKQPPTPPVGNGEDKTLKKMPDSIDPQLPTPKQPPTPPVGNGEDKISKKIPDPIDPQLPTLSSDSSTLFVNIFIAINIISLFQTTIDQPNKLQKQEIIPINQFESDESILAY